MNGNTWCPDNADNLRGPATGLFDIYFDISTKAITIKISEHSTCYLDFAAVTPNFKALLGDKLGIV
jgi:hypothetical protein